MASAYLDPSAGNALIYIAVTMTSVAAYAAKVLFYKLSGKKDYEHESNAYNDIAIFSEGKSYLNTFMPVVNALINKEKYFSYYTLDIEDPILKIRNKFLRRRYLGEGSAAFAKLNRTPCKVMLATTPNIGTPGYPMPRPAKTEFLVHVFHDPDGSIGYYKKGSLDNYDAVITPGDYAIESIRYIENLRNLKAKEIISLGLPYWDIMLKNNNNNLNNNAKKTVLLAPSWGDKGFMANYDLNFIKDLSLDFNIIFRPHPQSKKFEPELLNQAKDLIKSIPNAIWDEDIDPSSSLNNSDILISDTSAIRMDYAVIYKKPVISLEVNYKNIASFEAADMPEELRANADKFSVKVKSSEIKNIKQIIKSNLYNHNQANQAGVLTADNNIANLGTAGGHIADYLILKSREITERE